jgi:hypothetical protein
VTAKNEYVEVEHFPVSNSRKGKHEWCFHNNTCKISELWKLS